jgi:hypothetical protein
MKGLHVLSIELFALATKLRNSYHILWRMFQSVRLMISWILKGWVITTLNVAHLFCYSIAVFRYNAQACWCLYPIEAWKVLLLGKLGTFICSNSQTTMSISTLFWSHWPSKCGFSSPEKSCHKVWSFITVMQPHTVCIQHKRCCSCSSGNFQTI